MRPFWCKFKSHASACVEAANIDEAKAKATKEAGEPPLMISVLPYPATPILGAKESQCPEFCHQPERCAGLTCCPRRYACDN